MGWERIPYESTILPPAVRRVSSKVPRLRDHLRQNAFLDYATWKDLLSDHGDSKSTRYLTKNLTSRRAAQLLQRIGTVDVGSRKLSDIDLGLAAWYNQAGVRAADGRRILASELPHVSNVALRSGIDVRLKTRIARHAYRPNRLIWLSSREADVLTDETVWELANAPETLEECAEGTILDNNLREGTLRLSAVLLHVRPALKDRAIASGNLRWLMSVAAVRLDDDQQARLVTACGEHWKGEETEEIREALSRHDYGYYGKSAPDPLGVLASTPWCNEMTWSHLEGLSGNEEATTWVAGGDLILRDGLNNRNHRPIRRTEHRPMVELRTADEETAEKWLEWAHYSDHLCAPFVLLELLENRTLGARLGRYRREALLRSSRDLREVLLRHGNRFKPEQLERPHHWNHSDPETEQPRHRFWALPACPMQEALTMGDGGHKHLSEAGLTDQQLETALLLSGEFTGTVGQLVDVVKAL